MCNFCCFGGFGVHKLSLKKCQFGRSVILFRKFRCKTDHYYNNCSITRQTSTNNAMVLSNGKKRFFVKTDQPVYDIKGVVAKKKVLVAISHRLVANRVPYCDIAPSYCEKEGACCDITPPCCELRCLLRYHHGLLRKRRCLLRYHTVLLRIEVLVAIARRLVAKKRVLVAIARRLVAKKRVLVAIARRLVANRVPYCDIAPSCCESSCLLRYHHGLLRKRGCLLRYHTALLRIEFLVAISPWLIAKRKVLVAISLRLVANRVPYCDIAPSCCEKEGACCDITPSCCESSSLMRYHTSLL